ncbi:MAG: hypothetical protein K2V38_06735 [Gemmataceae bacterium]|nr:hypothetical protein [Gemmataceae bacterium]
MGALAEYLKAESDQLKNEKNRRREVLRDWVESLNALYLQMQQWLAACDPENLIESTIEQVPGRELTFGDHQLPVLKLILVDRVVRFRPLARFMAAMIRPPGQTKSVRVDGGVELRGLGGRDCYLFRLDGKWYVQKEFENLHINGNDVVPLDAERFEAVVRESLG